MTKLKKQRKRKVYRSNVNRKRLRNRIEGVGKITCKEIEKAWDRRKSVQTNLAEMGLSYDPNKTIEIPSNKHKITISTASNKNDWDEEEVETKPTKAYVMENLEADAKAPRVKLFSLPNKQIEWLSYLMDKYGKDYRAMAKDKKNYYQETWKQIRAKIKRFKSTSDYSNYLKSRNAEDKTDEDSDIMSDGEL